MGDPQWPAEVTDCAGEPPAASIGRLGTRHSGGKLFSADLDPALAALAQGNSALATARLARLDQDRQLLSRDISVVDLRLSDRVTVRLSEEAAQAREQARKDKTAKRKGSET